jgi:predicted esterase YcpF (UPF0227 family)
MSLDLAAILMNPQVDLNRLLNDYIENQREDYRLEAELVARAIREQRDHEMGIRQPLIDRVANVDMLEAPSRQNALLQESLIKIKSLQESQKKTIEQNKAHLEEAQRHKQLLLASYEEYRRKLDNAQPKLPSEKAFYNFSNAAMTYVATRNVMDPYATSSKPY